MSSKFGKAELGSRHQAMSHYPQGTLTQSHMQHHPWCQQVDQQSKQQSRGFCLRTGAITGARLWHPRLSQSQWHSTTLNRLLTSSANNTCKHNLPTETSFIIHLDKWKQKSTISLAPGVSRQLASP